MEMKFELTATKMLVKLKQRKLILYKWPRKASYYTIIVGDRLCGLVVRVSGYRSRAPGFKSRHYQIFRQVGGLERGPLSLVITNEELLEKKK
jgi:hypothetical protein